MANYPPQEDPIIANPVKLPGVVLAAAVLWIIFGAIILLNTLFAIMLLLALSGRIGGDMFGAALGGAACGGILMGFIGGAFVLVGVQTLTGSQKDTLGNGIGSILIAAIYGLLVIAGARNQGNLLTLFIGLAGCMGLLIAGILALVGRDQYLVWRQGKYPPITPYGYPPPGYFPPQGNPPPSQPPSPPPTEGPPDTRYKA